MSDRYLTISHSVDHETAKVKGSRFIALLRSAESDADVESALAEARRLHPHASHHCSAARVGHAPVSIRFSDDGEPGGSAGRPMLMQLEGRGVTYVAAIVVRYFGGTKLGVGGLVRAYGGAVAEALDRGDVAEVVLTREVRVTFDYDLTNAVQAFVHARGVATASESYDARVTFTFDLPRPEVDAFVAELNDRTSGRAEIDGEIDGA